MSSTCVSVGRFSLAGLYLVLVSVSALAQDGKPPRKIAVFGSSVASGAVDHQKRGGYAGRLGELLKPRGWEVVNVSKGGDNTRKIAPRFETDLLPQKAGYVLIGLSLSNEGIAKQPDQAYRDGIYEQWRRGMLDLIARCRASGMKVAVANCYARTTFAADPALYEYTRRMNVEISRWDVPSVNFLGAVDDGAGAWVKGLRADDGHPNGSGHQEMFLAIVPSVFEALEAGKPIPVKAVGDRWAHVPGGTSTVAPLSFAPADPVHSFAVSFWVKPSSDGLLAAVTGKAAVLRAEPAGGGDAAAAEWVEPGEQSVAATIEYRDGRFVYNGTGGTLTSAPTTDASAWRHIVLSHACARGITTLYVDGVSAGTVSERVVPAAFLLGGGSTPAATAAADVKEWVVYRSSLSPDEAQFLFQGGVFQSSLEVYAPLADTSFAVSAAVENRAQSMSQANVTGELQPCQNSR